MVQIPSPQPNDDPCLTGKTQQTRVFSLSWHLKITFRLLPSDAVCFLLFGRHLGGMTEKYKIFLKIKSPSSSFVVVLKIKSALNPAIKNNKTGNPKNFFSMAGNQKISYIKEKSSKTPNSRFLVVEQTKTKIFSENHFLSFCIYDRWSFLIFPSIYAPFLDHLTVLWRQFDGKEKAPCFKRCENHRISWFLRASSLSLLYFFI